MIIPEILVSAVLLVGFSPREAAAEPPAPCGCLPGFTVGWWYETNNAPPKPVCRCYKFVTDVASWAESQIYCMTMGANLLRIENSFEKKWVDSQLKTMQSTARHHLLEVPEYWLGATDLMKEGMWLWINPTSPMTGVGNWLPDGRDNFQGSENCLAVKRHVSCRGRRCQAPVYGWYSAACYQRKFYVCESDPISTSI